MPDPTDIHSDNCVATRAGPIFFRRPSGKADPGYYRDNLIEAGADPWRIGAVVQKMAEENA